MFAIIVAGGGLYFDKSIDTKIIFKAWSPNSCFLVTQTKKK
jgi:hypothetical protein